jgi:RHS repeat-associated protein
MNGTVPEYFLTDGLGSVRQLADGNGAVTMAKSYQPYGTEMSAVGSGSSSYGFTGEMTDPTGLTYLRARYYASGVGRFLTRDTWEGDSSQPMSYNGWNYVQSNPINFQDPTGHVRSCPWWFSDWAVKWRVNVAERYVSPTSDPMDTYVAAGIAIQCAGGDEWWNPFSGAGIAQITPKQAETEWGLEIKDDEDIIRGYGLRIRCPDGELEEALDPYNTKDAVILMKREIQLVTNACGSNCTDTDIYIAAALAQNGPGFTYIGMQKLPNTTPRIKKLYGVPDARINKDWFTYFADDAEDHDMVNTKTQLNRFVLVINELRRRRWIVPYIDSTVIDKLKNWQE